MKKILFFTLVFALLLGLGFPKSDAEAVTPPPNWDISGTWFLDFAGGSANREFRNLVQDEHGNVTGYFWWKSGGVWLKGGTLTGYVSGNDLYLKYDRYPTPYEGDFEGVITKDGMSGTFHATKGSSFSANWSTIGEPISLCTHRYSQGYWKQWLANNADVFEGHTNETLLVMLNTQPRGRNGHNVILSYQFIAAALNQEVYGCVMNPTVENAFNNADDFLHKSMTADRKNVLHWKDLLEFWNTNQKAVLQSVVYEGTCDLFGSHVGDKMTFTFSNDVFITDDIEVDRTGPVSQGYLRLHKHDFMDFHVNGNILTVTANTPFKSPRILDMRNVEKITGLYDFIGEKVFVPSGGISIDTNPTWPIISYKLDILSVNNNPAYQHYYTIDYNLNTGTVVNWSESSLHAPAQTLSNFNLDLDSQTISFKSVYNNGYTFYPAFQLNTGGTLTYLNQSNDNISNMTGIWEKNYKCD